MQEVLNRSCACTEYPLSCVRRVVRAEYALLEAPQAAGRREWLLLEHIQRRRCDLTGLKPFDERRLVDQGSSADVDQEAPGLHQSEGALADQMPGLGRKGAA